MVYGYARISTLDKIEFKNGKQLIDSQIQELKHLGCDIVMYDMESGLSEDRKELNKLLDIIKQGDQIICVEPSRITRSVNGMCKILKIAEEKKIKITLGSLVVDFTNGDADPISIAIMKLITTFSELEAELIRYRVRRGVNYSKNVKKIKLGRPKTTYDKIPQIFFYYLPKYQNKEINKSEFSKLTSLSMPSIYKYLGIINSQQI
ncbi:MAG: recombinase family protein [Bacilli bacterium]|nr:recombinase family protein [Bacilli bacterium]